EDGRVGMVAKLHHAMADGLAAVDFAVLVFDSSPDPVHAEPGEEWRPKPTPGRLELGVEAAAGMAGDMLSVARRAGTFAMSPRRQATKLAETVARVATVVRDDMLAPAPLSTVNVPIGPQRTLVRHRADLGEIRRAGRRPRLAAAATGKRITINDVYLAAVAGALRTGSPRRGESAGVQRHDFEHPGAARPALHARRAAGGGLPGGAAVGGPRAVGGRVRLRESRALRLLRGSTRAA